MTAKGLRLGDMKKLEAQNHNFTQNFNCKTKLNFTINLQNCQTNDGGSFSEIRMKEYCDLLRK